MSGHLKSWKSLAFVALAPLMGCAEEASPPPPAPASAPATAGSGIPTQDGADRAAEMRIDHSNADEAFERLKQEVDDAYEKTDG